MTTAAFILLAVAIVMVVVATVTGIVDSVKTRRRLKKVEDVWDETIGQINEEAREDVAALDAPVRPESIPTQLWSDS